MFEVFYSFLTAFTLSYFIIPTVINVAHAKHLCDEPNDRRSHTVTTPSLGGVAIFAGVMFSMVFWMPFTNFAEMQYLLCAFLVIFFMGVKDDIFPLSPYKKLLGQLMAASIVVVKSGIKVTSLHGFFGFTVIPEWLSIVLSVFTIIVIINSFNLIDGINGLSGSIALIVALTLGTWFMWVGNLGLAIMAYSLSGAVLAFLRYNVTPARIFMGDTGALLLGLILSILVIQFIEINEQLIGKTPLAVRTGPAVAIGILILPLFDTLRVFTIRILRGRSPFMPDRLHLHHLLLDWGMTHMQATGILATVSVFFIIMVFSLQSIGTFQLISLTVTLAWVLSVRLQKAVKKQKLSLKT